MASSPPPDSISDDENIILYSQSSVVATPSTIRKHFLRNQGTPKSVASSSTNKRRHISEPPDVPTPNRQQHHLELGSPAKPIELDDDDETPEAQLRHIIDLSDEHQNDDQMRPGRGEDEFSLEDYMTEAQLQKFLKRMSLEEEKVAKAKLEEREAIPSYSNEHPSFRCAAGKTVELTDKTFLRIKEVLKDGHGCIFLTGHRLIRQNSLGLMMPRRRNEVVLVREVPVATSDPWSVLHTVSINDVCKNRAAIFTSQTFPSVSSREDDAAYGNSKQDVEFGPLFCRWVFTTLVDERKKPVEDILERLSLQQLDDEFGPSTSSRQTKDGGKRSVRINGTQLRKEWRKCNTRLGGSHDRRETVAGLDDGANQTNVTSSYTFGDAFCGAGGTSRGGVDAGLKLLWGFDMNPEAIGSYKLNFARQHRTDCRTESVSDFIAYLDQLVELDGIRVDVMHISPPCQPFSPAHTIPSQERDETNQAALPSVWNLVHKLRPRIVTIEETEGLFSRHRDWFYLLINIFTSSGYSVRWKVVQCHAYGVPQTRKRLLVVAAGPGEQLPPFPQPTHGPPGSGLQPLITINRAITNIPATAEDHDQGAKFDGPPRLAFDGNIQAKTITTNAGQGNYHPSGRRPYTLRELASLQTFPYYHSFAGANGITEKKRQIGNAVPPRLAKAMFKSIVESLKESDEKETANAQVQ